MQVECSKCHRMFYTSQEDLTFCPECLKKEFQAAPKLNDNELSELKAQYKGAARRQSARAERMNVGYLTGETFSTAGKIRFGIGVVLFILCLFVFLVGESNPSATPITELDPVQQRIVSVVFCWVAAGFVYFSTRRRPKLILSIAALFVLSGWYMPVFWAMVGKAVTPAAKVVVEEEKKAVTPEDTVITPTDNRRVLTDADISVYTQHAKRAQHLAHYGVYIDVQDGRARNIIRDAMTRILGAEYTRPYTRANGALFLVANVQGNRKDISPLLSRLGRVTYADVQEGVYEVLYDAEKANMVSHFSAEVLGSPNNTSFVSANISEMGCLDPMRVRMAANALANADVHILRREVHDAFARVLQEPWGDDQDTYTQLIRGLIVYSYPKDKVSIDLCRNYFRSRYSMHKEVDDAVIKFLIRETPDEMVAPIVEFWCENPVAWASSLKSLGLRVQAPLLDRLQTTNSIRQIGAILKYLQDNGTKDALPVVELFSDHPDSIIRHSARTTIEALRKRN